MSKRIGLHWLLTLWLVALPSAVCAEEVEEEGQNEPMSFGLQALTDRFEAAAPAVGEQVPNIEIYTAAGDRVQFHDLVLGHHTVLVFGCLT